MVAGKVRVTMGFHKSPSSKPKDMASPLPLPLPPPPPPPPLKPPSGSACKPANPGSNQKPGFTRSFGVYFPRASAQVHNASSRSSEQNGVVSELRRQVEELREREALLKTDVLELKLLRESVSVIPLLESQIAEKNSEIEESRKETARLAEENERLRRDIEASEELRRDSERREKEMEAETVELRKLVSSSLRESDDHSLSVFQRFQGLMDVSAKSNLIRSLKRVGSMRNIPDPIPNQESKTIIPGDDDGDIYRKHEIESHSMSNSEELNESSLSTVRSRVPRVPKPPPKRSFSSNGFVESTENRADPPPQRSNPPPPPPPPPLLQHSPPPSVSKAPPPPPPPPPPKSLNIASAKVRRVPEVVEFYHSLMRRDSTNSRRDSTGGGNAAAEAILTSANARDMIGEIENRSVYLLAVKFSLTGSVISV